jgi:asparagine synthetase B (glutamine-hydrolysing)
LFACQQSLAAWGIEGRVPFLDKEFMDVAMRINPQDKMINKGIQWKMGVVKHLKICYHKCMETKEQFLMGRIQLD